jgi:predicted NACHT family NTPase
MFILGEFGDGKTTFTYFLARNLALDFLNDPDNGWIPVRFSLKYYQSAKDPQTFLERRLSEFNADNGSWNDLRNEKRNLLVILDGFDEMTPKLDTRTIKQNTAILILKPHRLWFLLIPW